MQVYKLSIGAACGLSWPTDRLVIQVLDDSTDPIVKVKEKEKKNNPLILLKYGNFKVTFFWVRISDQSFV